MILSCKRKSINDCCLERTVFLSKNMHYINKVVIDGVDSTQYYEPTLGVKYFFSEMKNGNENYFVGYDSNHYYAEYSWETKECDRIKIHTGDQFGSNFLLATDLNRIEVVWNISEENGTMVTTTTFNGHSFKLYWGPTSVANLCNSDNCCLSDIEKGLLNITSFPDTLIYTYGGDSVRFLKYQGLVSDTINGFCIRRHSVYLNAELSQNNYGLVPAFININVTKYSGVFLSMQFGGGIGYQNNWIVYINPEIYHSSPSVSINGYLYENVFYKSFKGSPYSELGYNKDFGIVTFTYNGIKFELLN